MNDQQIETMRYIDRYHGVAYLTARTAINEVLFDVPSRNQYTRLRSDKDLLEAYVTEHKVKIHILTLSEVYGNLARCVDTGVCSKCCMHEFLRRYRGLEQYVSPTLCRKVEGHVERRPAD